jgi:site-specific DNA-cytosine methylase
MKILELFAGSRSIGREAENLGHEVFSVDIEPFDGIDYVVDILDFCSDVVPFIPDMIWASPPCTSFSVASIGRHWVKGEEFTPKTEAAEHGVRLLEATLDIIEEFQSLNPDLVYFVENPRGKMRKAPHLALHPRHTVTYCQYGDTRMKPTDIWSNSLVWVSRLPCKNGDTCHVAAPRGSQTGTQGIKGNYERSKIPQELCREVILAADAEFKYFS